ncbi:LPP20 family lipoprotein [Psychrobium sp. 1_MG-2023]|uniref:LPP20 family lipoprotein n=1 Tax=Psychrobium sp. 1_MG-2023 TaxID=3062624 RepID=UPI000C3233F4|nr:LPP20 family lipoprotein [Psychrobium sp. 1_MG-2023]MDP2559879.1 LPP20 family lipoprotein [Psychrobium sp. 1_MG-2023]PKF59020.1 flagellar biosynthesis protein FlgP [Alteromonadales bacterium alter-6D02]
MSKTLKIILFTSILSLVGCNSTKFIEYETQQPQEFVVLTAIGYAPINQQPGKDRTTKMLNAIHASKLNAYRELSEQVHGFQLNGQTTFNQLIIENSSMQTSVQGLIRGATVKKSYPIDDDIYATELELDFKTIYQLYQSANLPRRVKN